MSSAPSVSPMKPTKKRRGWLVTSAPATFDKVALVSAALGVLAGIGLCVMWHIPSLGVYMLANALFHLLEFWVTARYNITELGMASFLLLNGVGYAAAQGLAVVEYLLKWYWNGHAPCFPSAAFAIGLAAMITGQVMRTGAMIQASQSFNHYVQTHHKVGHELVRHGFYRIVRHPSYLGFLLWAAGSQILLSNLVSAVAFTAILDLFFVLRLRTEEAALCDFFGDAYVDYRRQVWSGIPFVA